ncbi:MAG: HisA/HisF-related TIM barrel protein, partial [Acidimicrobiales bacterium]
MIEVYPAIDLRDGKCVRLYQGDFGRETVYGEDPVDQARQFANTGTPWVHMVDLDAARTGAGANREVILEVARALAGSGTKLQVGGGVRDDDAVSALLNGGVDRVVLGTAALDRPKWVHALATAHRGRVAVGLDARRTGSGWEVAVRGWVEGSGRDLFATAESFTATEIAALVVTEIGRDGTLT